MEATQALELARAYPTAFDLRERARRLMPHFAFGYMDGGSGHEDLGIRRNWEALDEIELVPRYGRVARPPESKATIFGHEYSAPIGISPIGGPGTAYPGAELYLAAAAQKMNVPYTLGLLSGIDVEHAVTVCPDVLWYQLYRFAHNEHAIGFDLTRRAAAAGVKTLVLTMDTPTRTIRPRETKSGIQHPFRVTWRLRADALSSPRWLAAFVRHGMPRFAALKPYMKPSATLEEVTSFIRRESGGAFTWDEVARYREVWKGRLVLKGILHPGDARKALELGADGLIVSNHGGRQIDCLPAAIDMLPGVVSEVSGRLTVLFDSGVRSGVDVARAIALGADAAFVGKAFLWSLGALGPDGPEHLIRVLTDDLRACLGQLGCREVADLRMVEGHSRHGTLRA